MDECVPLAEGGAKNNTFLKMASCIAALTCELLEQPPSSAYFV